MWCLSKQPSGRERPHERAVVADHAAALVTDAVCLDEVGVDPEQSTVVLVVREARKAEQGQATSLAPSAGRK